MSSFSLGSALSVPTDNLYKFMAVTGLLFIFIPPPLILSGIYLIQDKSYQAQVALVELENDINFFRERDINDLQKEDVTELETRLETLKLTSEMLSSYTEDIRTGFWLMVSTGIFGTFLSALGFTLWYSRTQRLQDLLLQRQVSASNKE